VNTGNTGGAPCYNTTAAATAASSRSGAGGTILGPVLRPHWTARAQGAQWPEGAERETQFRLLREVSRKSPARMGAAARRRGRSLGPVNGIKEAFDDPQIRARGLLRMSITRWKAAFAKSGFR